MKRKEEKKPEADRLSGQELLLLFKNRYVGKTSDKELDDVVDDLISVLSSLEESKKRNSFSDYEAKVKKFKEKWIADRLSRLVKNAILLGKENVREAVLCQIEEESNHFLTAR